MSNEKCLKCEKMMPTGSNNCKCGFCYAMLPLLCFVCISFLIFPIVFHIPQYLLILLYIDAGSSGEEDLSSAGVSWSRPSHLWISHKDQAGPEGLPGLYPSIYQATHCMVTYIQYMYCTCRWKGDNVFLLLYDFKDLHLYLHVT